MAVAQVIGIIVLVIISLACFTVFGWIGAIILGMFGAWGLLASSISTDPELLATGGKMLVGAAFVGAVWYGWFSLVIFVFRER